MASSDGITINEHFGQARRFFLYEVDAGGSFREAGAREIHGPLPVDREEHHSTDATARALADMDAVLVKKIGPGGAETLKAHGVKAFVIGGPVVRALSANGRRHKRS